MPKPLPLLTSKLLKLESLLLLKPKLLLLLTSKPQKLESLLLLKPKLLLLLTSKLLTAPLSTIYLPPPRW
jgi:hypothetical protein